MVCVTLTIIEYGSVLYKWDIHGEIPACILYIHIYANSHKNCRTSYEQEPVAVPHPFVFLPYTKQPKTARVDKVYSPTNDFVSRASTENTLEKTVNNT